MVDFQSRDTRRTRGSDEDEDADEEEDEDGDVAETEREDAETTEQGDENQTGETDAPGTGESGTDAQEADATDAPAGASDEKTKESVTDDATQTSPENVTERNGQQPDPLSDPTAQPGQRGSPGREHKQDGNSRSLEKSTSQAEPTTVSGDREPADGRTDVSREQRPTEGGSGQADTARGPPETVTYAVVTVATGSSLDDDPTGRTVVDAVEAAGGAVVTRELLTPSYDGIQTAVGALVSRADVDAIVTAGGTGVGPQDVTVDAVGDLLDKHLPGFGELFRVLSHDHEGTAIVRTRATAGVIDDVPVFCLPGNPESARRGVEQIVVHEAAELVAQASGGTDDAT